MVPDFSARHAQRCVSHGHDRDFLWSEAEVREDSLSDQMIHGAEGAHGNDLAFQVDHRSNLRPRDQIKAGLGHHREHASQRRALDGPADASAEGGGVVDAAAQNAGQRNGGSDLDELRRDSGFAKVAFGLGQQGRKIVEVASDITDNNPPFLRGRRGRTFDYSEDGERSSGEKKPAPAQEPQPNNAHERLSRKVISPSSQAGQYPVMCSFVNLSRLY